MFDDINKLYFLIAIIGITFLYWLIQQMRPKTWIWTSAPGKALRNIGYLKTENNELFEMKLTNEEIKRPAARIATDKNDNAVVWIANGDMEDEECQNDYRMRGYITQDGLIYKQSLKQEEPILIGYTARASKPEEPTINGKRSWYTLWLDKELNVYEGDPKIPVEDPTQRRVGYICLSGITFKNPPIITREAHAGAAALLYRKYGPKEEKINTYKEPVYGWNDTALLTSIVYSILFLMLYFTYTCILRRPLLGDDFAAVFILAGCYYALWAIIRQIKINCIERSMSFQPQLDMLNKGLSLGKFDSITVSLCGIAMIYTYHYYDYDLLPLIYAIGFGITKNGITHAMKRPWTIISNYDEEQIQDEEEELVKPFALMLPPTGEMTRTYDWDLDSANGVTLHGNLSIHFSMDEYTNCRNENPYFSQRIEKPKQDYINEMFNRMIANSKLTERVRYIASYIINECQYAKLGEMDRLQFALDFVQEPNIDFILDKNSKSIQFASEYVRYPDETLFDQEGDSDCKSMLAAMILFFMGYNIVYLSSNKRQHSAIAIELKTNPWLESYINTASLDDIIVDVNHHQYIYCETTGDGYRIGKLIEDIRINDFETRVELRQSSLEELNE